MAKYVVEDTKLTAVADAIREKTGKADTMEVDEMPLEIRSITTVSLQENKEFIPTSNDVYEILPDDGYDGIKKVTVITNPLYDDAYNGGYADGKQAEYDAFWDMYQNNGTRTDYNYAFCGGGYRDRTAGWNDDLFNPKYPFMNLVRASYMFINTQIEKKSISLHLSELTTDLYQTFYGANLIQNIELWVHENLTYTSTFAACYNLENLTIQGVIGQNISFENSNRLSHDSLMSIINALKDITGDGVTRTCTLGAGNLAKLTDEEKAVATEKGWTLA